MQCLDQRYHDMRTLGISGHGIRGIYMACFFVVVFFVFLVI